MLKKRQRLTKKEFDIFFKQGKRKHSEWFQVIHTNHPSFHGAAVVGKKISKKAVDRNVVRRRMYAALYALYKEQNLSGVFIMIAKPAIKSITYKEIKNELSKLIDSR